jgi:inner membrane protein
VLTRRVEATYAAAESVRVFPLPFSVGTWRYVAILPGGVLATGEVPLAGAPREARRVESSVDALPPDVRAVGPVREALAWARFPVVTVAPVEGGGREVRISDLRYHLRGEPTLGFVIRLDAGNRVAEARLERGGSASELLRRWRGQDAETTRPQQKE